MCEECEMVPIEYKEKDPHINKLIEAYIAMKSVVERLNKDAVCQENNDWGPNPFFCRYCSKYMFVNTKPKLQDLKHKENCILLILINAIKEEDS